MGWSVVFILFCSFIRGACIYEGVFGSSFRKILDIPSSIENPLIIVIKSKEDFFFFFMYFRRDNQILDKDYDQTAERGHAYFELT